MSFSFARVAVEQALMVRKVFMTRVVAILTTGDDADGPVRAPRYGQLRSGGCFGGEVAMLACNGPGGDGGRLFVD